MNPQDNTMDEKMEWQLTEEERRQRETRVQVAVNKLERMEHHIPPRKGEHCYFNSHRDREMDGMIPTGRYICVTNTSQSVVWTLAWKNQWTRIGHTITTMASLRV